MKIFFTLLLFLLGGCAQRYHEPCYIRPIAPHVPEKPMRQEPRTLVIIDPGHGGKDAGALSLSKPIAYEKNLNLDAARFLEAYLKQNGFITTMTRRSDAFVSLDQRAELANEQKAAYFVSVHFNSAPNRSAKGIEVFYYENKEEAKRTQGSKELAEAVLEALIRTTGAKSRGVKQGNFAVIRKTNMPAILVEGGFMTHEEEMQNLRQASYLQKMAKGIAEGVDSYARKNKKT